LTRGEDGKDSLVRAPYDEEILDVSMSGIEGRDIMSEAMHPIIL
jgi:hypothetical protein